jgi:hypothetical protein
LKSEPDKRYPDVVYKIHKEFFTSSDILLEEASNILNKKESDLHKIDRLKNIGFNKTKEVVENDSLVQKKKLSEELSQIIKDYSFRYPNNKFITEENVTAICDKYNLFLGNIEDFKGFVPDKNLIEIENFKLQEKDFVNVFHLPKGYVSFIWRQGDFTISELCDLLGAKFPEGVILEMARTLRVSGKKRDKLKIAAPLKDFDLNGKITSHRKIVNAIPPDDPIVLQSVPGGYLILTAWGDEASDPLIVNEKMN